MKILIPEWKEKYTAGRMNDFDEKNSIHFWCKYSFLESGAESTGTMSFPRH